MIKNGKNDFDIWQEAINKMDLTEAVAPLVRGRILLDESEVEMYNKIQKLLNADGMESCHKFLYSLDPSQLTEAETSKVCNLWNLACERGCIETEEDNADDSSDTESTDECDLIAKPVDDVKTPIPVAAPSVPLKTSAFTVMYSAMRDGTIKCGEAYSNCINTRSAKADVISKLERAGYQNISILAIEAGDPDTVGCDNTYYKQAEQPTTQSAIINDTTSDDIPDYSVDEDDDKNEETDEADDTDPMAHALDPVHVKASSATLKYNDVASMSEVNEEDDKDDDSSDDDSDSSDDSEDKDDDSKDDDSDKDKEDDDKDDEEELTAEKKTQLKDSYKKAFKAAMQKCKFETSFSELSLEDKVKFFTELSKAWKDKADPSKFMTDKEVDQLEKIVVKKN